MTPAAEELSLLGIQLASQFLFHTGFRTKKSLRGPVIEWYDTLSHHIRFSSSVRKWFASNALLSPPARLGEYILMAPSPEVRTVFVKLVVFFCHFAINDEALAGHDGNNLCEQILISVLKLLKCEVADHGKHLPHYFSLFSMYVGLGKQEKQQLLKLNVPVIFMQVALEEGPGPSIKYQYPELSKLHQVVSHLIRCSDISDRCQSSNQNGRPLPNPYKDPNIRYEDLLPLSPECVEILFNRTGYIKKLIEDTNVGEEGLKLLQYCSWENPHFSRAVLTELLWQCGYAYCHDMRHHTEILLHILLIEDSWQHHRIHNALNGVAEEREGLLDTIQRAKTHYQKRAYQIIKCLTQLFHKSPVALQMLNSNAAITRHWIISVEWLQDELDRQRGIGCQYNSYSWSPPAQSNDTTNGYMLERSHSAKNTWTMAYELCPEEEQEETNESDVEPSDETQRQQQQANTTATKTDYDLRREQKELNRIADVMRNNLTVEEATQLQLQLQQQQQQNLETGETLMSNVPSHKSTIIVGLAPGSSIDWKANTFVSDSSTIKTPFTSTTNTSSSPNTVVASSSTPSSSTVAMTESQNESNINGLTGNLKQLTLSPKMSVSGVISSETPAALAATTTTGTTVTGITKMENDLNILNVLNNTITMTTTTNTTIGNNTADTQQQQQQQQHEHEHEQEQQSVNTTKINVANSIINDQNILIGTNTTSTTSTTETHQQQQLNTTTKT